MLNFVLDVNYEGLVKGKAAVDSVRLMQGRTLQGPHNWTSDFQYNQSELEYLKSPNCTFSGVFVQQLLSMVNSCNIEVFMIDTKSKGKAKLTTNEVKWECTLRRTKSVNVTNTVKLGLLNDTFFALIDIPPMDVEDERPATVVVDSSLPCAEYPRLTDLSKSDMSNLTTADFMAIFTAHRPLRKSVKGNGTCWLDAIMGTLHVLEHGNTVTRSAKQEENPPTTKDIGCSQILLEEMKNEMLEVPAPVAKSSLLNFKIFEQKVHDAYVWLPLHATGSASFSAHEFFWLISRLCGRQVIIMDLKILQLHDEAKSGAWENAGEHAQHRVFNGESGQKMGRALNLVAVIRRLEEEPWTLVIEFNGKDHYAYYSQVEAIRRYDTHRMKTTRKRMKELHCSK